ILDGSIPSTKVHEDEHCLAFRDIAPAAPTHVVLIPKEKAGMSQLSKATPANKEVLGHLMLVAGEIGRKECPEGFRVVVNDGVQGAQSVYHLHLHVIGGRQMAWPPG
ncbi:hypothetical protein TeGR_g6998, partial [Tetraparma gracilis]